MGTVPNGFMQRYGSCLCWFLNLSMGVNWYRLPLSFRITYNVRELQSNQSPYIVRSKVSRLLVLGVAITHGG